MAEPRDSGARDEWRVVAKLEADEEGHSLVSGSSRSTSMTRPASA